MNKIAQAFANAGLVDQKQLIAMEKEAGQNEIIKQKRLKKKQAKNFNKNGIPLLKESDDEFFRK